MKVVPIYQDINEYGEIKVNKEAVLESVKNILSTRVSERLFEPEFGSELEGLIGELMTEETAFKIRYFIVQAINRWDPRLEVVPGLTEVVPEYENHRYLVTIAFRIIGLNEEVESVSFYLEQ